MQIKLYKRYIGDIILINKESTEKERYLSILPLVWKDADIAYLTPVRKNEVLHISIDMLTYHSLRNADLV